MTPNNYIPLIRYSPALESMSSEYRLNIKPRAYGRTLEYSIDQSFHGKYEGLNKGDYLAI